MFAAGIEEAFVPVDDKISMEGGIMVPNFDEYTFHAPRPGYFLGDEVTNSMGNLCSFANICLAEDRASQWPTDDQLRSILYLLPAELLINIILRLDLGSVILLRQTNRFLRSFIDSIPVFRSVVEFPKLLGAVLQLRCHFFDLKTLGRCLVDLTCSYCGNFGDMLYVVTAERWCYSCWAGRKENTPILVPSDPTSPDREIAEREALEQLGYVPHVFLSPGIYAGMGQASTRNPRLAFDQRSLSALPNPPDWEELKILHYPHQLKYTVVIRAPYFDGSTNSWEEGVLCRACAYQGWKRLHLNWIDEWRLRGHWEESFPTWGEPFRRFTRDGMRDHVEEHGEILRLVDNESPSGTRLAHKNPPSSRSRHPRGLKEISDLLRRCLEKEFQFPQLQLYSPKWDRVLA